MREAADQSEYCTIREGCRVVSRPCEDPPTVEYIDRDGEKRQIQGEWLIGADGKVGIVRKHFLEPTAGIIQEEGKYPYSGTWIAANLKLTPPTPQTHPDFPLWRLGYSPEEVYDLFWPKGWHFCSPPGKPTASGRFGPCEDRTWRHELRQEDWNDSMNAEELFWEHLLPMITLQRDDERHREFAKPVQYPTDCIEILRCRSFRFTHKVVNRWFHKRTILIGDAAHVFPPFAGQGIGSGIRDAHQLAWRLALIVKMKHHREAETILGSWALERRKSVDDAAMLSYMNGRLCNDQPLLWIRVVLALVTFLKSSRFLPRLPDPQVNIERKGFSSVQGGFRIGERNGGTRLAQILLRSNSGGEVLLSDTLLRSCNSLFTILAIARSEDYGQVYEGATLAVKRAAVEETIVSEGSIVMFSPDCSRILSESITSDSQDRLEVFSPASRESSRDETARSEDAQEYMNRLGRRTQYALVRPDLFFFACCKDANELEESLLKLRGQLHL